MKKLLLTIAAIAVAGVAIIVRAQTASEVVRDGAGNIIQTFTNPLLNPTFESVTVTGSAGITTSGSAGIVSVPVATTYGTAMTLSLNRARVQEVTLSTGTTAITFAATGTNAVASTFYLVTGTGTTVLSYTGHVPLQTSGGTAAIPTSLATGAVLRIEAEQGLGTGGRTIFTRWSRVP